ncbi:hypothetical protein [Pseudonocardia humida]|uniref:O-methyltransferase n=1 Tax=Pseudonocardia humida TaxID=2800819 RepID=A0ABT1A377_9PSEU|nr:hypothetical protein [Pseudonocardia humida]MCO1657466.1 hypothetical protein [Pseudonocardia humida]
MTRLDTVVEFGTSFGISTLHLAEAGLAAHATVLAGDAPQTRPTTPDGERAAPPRTRPRPGAAATSA